MALLETGVASDVLDLLSRINTRLGLAGWTVTKYDTVDPNDQFLYFNRLIDGTTRYFQARATASTNSLYFAGATGFDTGQGWDTQPGKSRNSLTNHISSPIKQYKFFGAASYFYVSIQKQTGIYGHSGVGVLEKCGTWVGGEFCYGTNILLGSAPNYAWDDADSEDHAYPFDSFSSAVDTGCIRVDTGFGSGVWHPFAYYESIKAHGGGRRFSLISRLRVRSGPNQFNGQTILLPSYCFIRKQVPEAAFLYAGFPPDLRFLNIAGLNYEDSLVLGVDTWQTFPILQKNGAPTQPNSGIYGIAYKEN